MLALRFTSASNGGIHSSHLRELLTPYGGEWGGWRELQFSELQFCYHVLHEVLEFGVISIPHLEDPWFNRYAHLQCPPALVSNVYAAITV